MRKAPIDIDLMVQRIREAVRPYPKAAMFELQERGFGTPFQQLVACMLSIRTKDEVSLPAALALFERAPTAHEVAKLKLEEIDPLIRLCAFHEAKALQILEIARTANEKYGGDLPCDFGVLTSFRGVGPKCANLALGVACGEGGIAVDVHVDRITNRWGYVATTNPEATMAALEAKLPKPYWIEINALLVPFGKHICTARRPNCTTCPVRDMCRQVGVTEHR